MNGAMLRGSGVLPLVLGGFLGGLIGGALGAGGGIIVVFTLNSLMGGKPAGQKNGNDVFATALCVMLPLSLFSALMYGIRGNVSVEGFGPFVIPAVLGGACGGLLLGKFRNGSMKRAFAALVAISGVLLIIR